MNRLSKIHFLFFLCSLTISCYRTEKIDYDLEQMADDNEIGSDDPDYATDAESESDEDEDEDEDEDKDSEVTPDTEDADTGSDGDTDTDVDTDTGSDGDADTDTVPYCDDASDCAGLEWPQIPRATTEVLITLNLDSTTSALYLPWDPANAGSTSNYSVALGVFDVTGASHRIDIFFRKGQDDGYPRSDNFWHWYVVYWGGESNSSCEECAAGVLLFTVDGMLEKETTYFSKFIFTNNLAPQYIYFNFGKHVPGNCRHFNGTTQLASSSHTRLILSNGHDGSGEWECRKHECQKNYYICGVSHSTPCCGDTICTYFTDENSDTCPEDCIWVDSSILKSSCN
ncbi:MAG: hypothetical protein GY847_05145 [Proteobacteria bacterium]|nr:hypothetical protein [Pseudomonadota bacterium]